jgi:hypothetical protein
LREGADPELFFWPSLKFHKNGIISWLPSLYIFARAIFSSDNSHYRLWPAFIMCKYH